MDKKKLRYAILKEIDSGNEEITEKELQVDANVFDEAVWFLNREGYIAGVKYASNRPWDLGARAYVTEKGENYLSENSALTKAYKGLKEIRDWLKI